MIVHRRQSDMIKHQMHACFFNETLLVMFGNCSVIMVPYLAEAVRAFKSFHSMLLGIYICSVLCAHFGVNFCVVDDCEYFTRFIYDGTFVGLTSLLLSVH